MDEETNREINEGGSEEAVDSSSEEPRGGGRGRRVKR